MKYTLMNEVFIAKSQGELMFTLPTPPPIQKETDTSGKARGQKTATWRADD